VGGVIGVGIAALGADGVVWGWKGVAQIFAAWVIAPGIAGCFGAILYLITKYGVLKRKNSFRKGLYYIPVYFALTSGVLTMLIVWKGGKPLGEKPPPPFLLSGDTELTTISGQIGCGRLDCRSDSGLCPGSRLQRHVVMYHFFPPVPPSSDHGRGLDD
jgi:hypothetical protein